MLRIITPEPSPAPSYLEQEAWRPESYGDDFEIVIGKRQVASLLFVGIVIVAIAAGLSYVGGRAAGIKDTAPAAPVPQAAAPPVVVQLAEIELLDLPGPAAAELSAPLAPTVANAPQGVEENLFARITIGGRYLQVASVDRSAAVVLAQGLRQRGFKGFLAPGAQEDVYRVMIGPFENSGESQGARVAIAAIGASTSKSNAAR